MPPVIDAIGRQRRRPIIEIRTYAHDERVEVYTRFHSERQHQQALLLAQNPCEVTRALTEYGQTVLLYEGCIVLRMMLIRAESLRFYKDPKEKTALGDKIKELLKTLPQENNLEFSDVDGIKIHISEEDIQEAEHFFRIGEYHSRWLISVVTLILKIVDTDYNVA